MTSKVEAKVLVIDDDPTLMELLAAAMEGEGYRVVTAADGEAGLQKAIEARPDLIILDIRIPLLTGYEVSSRLKNSTDTCNIPILMITGWPELSDRPRAKEMGADDLLMKPFTKSELLTRVKNMLRMKSMEDILHRYVSDDVAAQVLANPYAHLKPGGDRKIATMLFGDVRGFTSLCEELSPEDAVAVLNQYLERLVEIVFEHEGTLDKFRGDGIMAVFGAPVTHDDDPHRAVKAALEMQEVVSSMQLPEFPQVRLTMGIGINTGPVIAGNIGSNRRMDYTVIGDVVNLAARFESNAGPGQILISDATYQYVKDCVEVQDLGTLRVKGKTEWVRAYNVFRWIGESTRAGPLWRGGGGTPQLRE